MVELCPCMIDSLSMFQSTSLRTHMKQHVKQQLAKVVNNVSICLITGFSENISLKEGVKLCVRIS